jgi:hypothetical protein
LFKLLVIVQNGSDFCIGQLNSLMPLRVVRVRNRVQIDGRHSSEVAKRKITGSVTRESSVVWVPGYSPAFRLSSLGS